MHIILLQCENSWEIEPRDELEARLSQYCIYVDSEYVKIYYGVLNKTGMNGKELVRVITASV